MDLQTLREELKITGARSGIRRATLVELFGKPLVESLFGTSSGFDIAQAECVGEASSSKFAMKGKAGLGALRLPADTDVEVSFELPTGSNRENVLHAAVRFSAPRGWRFADAFPQLSVYSDGAPSLLDSLRFDDACFVLSNYAGREWKAGLNFTAGWRPGGVLGLLTGVLEAGHSVRLYGSVHFPSQDGKLPKLEEGTFPWEYEGAIPGVCLQATLGTIPSFFGTAGDGRGEGQPENIEVRARVYIPVSLGLVLDWPDCQPMLAYVGTIKIPGGSLEFTGMHSESSRDELILKAAFRADHDGAHDSALQHLTQGASLTTLVPEQLRDMLSQLHVADVAFHLVAGEKERYGLAATRISIGIGEDPKGAWRPFDRVPIALKGVHVAVIVVNPSDSGGQRMFFGTVRADTELFGALFAVTIQAPGFSVLAEQVGGRIDVGKLFEEHLPAGTPKPPQFAIDHVSLAIEPGSYYAFSLTIAAGEAWKIEGGYELPSVRLSISNLGWSVEARVENRSKAVPLLLLLQKLAGDIPEFRPDVPDTLKSLTVETLALAYDTSIGTFSFDCEGSLRLSADEVARPAGEHATAASTVLRVKLAATVKRAVDGRAPEARFGGSLIMNAESEAPLEFDVEFGSSGECSVLLAGFHDGRGHPIRVCDLLKAIPHLDELARSVPQTLEFTLHDAVLAYTREKSGASNCLLGLDIEGGIELSAPRLPALPLVSEWSAVGEPLRLALQVTVAKDAFAAKDVTALKTLSEAAAFLPDSGVQKHVGLNAALRIGTEQKRLSLPIGAQDLAEPHESAGPQPRADSTPSQADVASADGVQWLKVQKSFGPLHVERVGVRYKDGKVGALFDAGLTVAGLTVSLDGLSVSTPLKPLAPVFSLRGLGIDYRNSAVEIGGAFLACRSESGEITGFAGTAIVRAKQLTLSASGMFTQVNGHPSLFLYAVLDGLLAGPSFFVVTGLAAGFGYNRTLTLPSLDELPAFPLIAQAKPPLAESGTVRDPMQILSALERYVPPAVGESFLAVGVRFTSFKIIDSFALLIGRFSHRFEIDLLGVSTLVSPPNPPAGTTPIAEAQLALKAVFIPDEGILTVQALLTPASYVLSRQCRLSGGFAFYSWFKDQEGPDGAKAGDFVATLGGYHPAFKPPPHYPAVPRLQLLWQVNDQLTIKGSAYYALTAHALMAGGLLEAVWHDNDVRACFRAAADFLLSWQPYHYDANVSVVMQAEVTIHVFGTHHLSFDAGADVHLWGPEFSGTADIHLRILVFDVSFNVAFGDHAALPEAVDWKAFRTAFLPKDLCGVAVEGGLVRAVPPPESAPNAPERWIVDPAQAAFAVTAAVPVTSVVNKISGGGATHAPIGIPPMAVEPGAFESVLEVTVTREQPGDATGDFAFTPLVKAVPAALWGKPSVTHMYGKTFVEKPDLNAKGFVDAAWGGVSMRPAASVFPGAAVPYDPEHEEPEMVESAFGWAEPVEIKTLLDRAPREQAHDRDARDEMLLAIRLLRVGSAAREPARAA